MGQGTGSPSSRSLPRPRERTDGRLCLAHRRPAGGAVEQRPRALGARSEAAAEGHAALPSARATHAAQLRAYPCALGAPPARIPAPAALQAMVLSRAAARSYVAAAKAAQRRHRVDGTGKSPSPPPASQRAALYVHVSGRGQGAGRQWPSSKCHLSRRELTRCFSLTPR